MGTKMKIADAARQVGLSEYALRIGCRQGKYPHITIGSGSQKHILIDVDLLEEFLRQEAIENVTYQREAETVDYGQLRRVPEH